MRNVESASIRHLYFDIKDLYSLDCWLSIMIGSLGWYWASLGLLCEMTSVAGVRGEWSCVPCADSSWLYNRAELVRGAWAPLCQLLRNTEVIAILHLVNQLETIRIKYIYRDCIKQWTFCWRHSWRKYSRFINSDMLRTLQKKNYSLQPNHEIMQVDYRLLPTLFTCRSAYD